MATVSSVIKKGDKIRVKDNVVEELIELDFMEDSAQSMKVFEGTEQEALGIWEDKNSGQVYITVDLCCEIPIQCCEKIK